MRTKNCAWHRNPHFSVLTICTAEVEPLGRLSLPNKQLYCKRNGYDFVVSAESLSQSRRVMWSKIPLLQEHLSEYEWLFWSDADSLITNPATKIESLVDDNAELIISRENKPQNPGGFNSGQYLLRGKSAGSKNFLDAVWSQKQFVDHPYGDQAAMNHVLDQALSDIRVKEVPKRAINSEPSEWQPGDFVLHLPGRVARVYLMRKAIEKLFPEMSIAPPPVEVNAAAALREPPEPAVAAGFLSSAFKHLQAEELRAAEDDCRQALNHDPHNANAMQLLGLVLHEAGRNDEALDLICRSIELNPDIPDFRNNLGSVLGKLGEPEEAENILRKAVGKWPGHPGLKINLGISLFKQDKFVSAEEQHRAALLIQPKSAEAYMNLAAALRRQGRVQEAIDTIREALRLAPDSAEAHREMANALGDWGDLDSSIRHLRQSADLQPRNAAAHSDLLFVLLHAHGDNGDAIRQEHTLWASRHVEPRGAGNYDHAGVRPSSERRLRVGYVSPDFRFHPVANFLEPLIGTHNSDVVEVYCYSDVWKPDAMTERLRLLADKWHGSAGWSDEQLLKVIRSDKIDILVDLAGHTANNRLLLFARRAAPVQVSYCGYPATTGIQAIDYKLTDSWHDPIELDTDAHFVEKLWRLPRCAWAYRPPEELAESPGPLPARTNGYVTFGSMNRLQKVTPFMIGLWSQILRAVPRSRLLILAGEGNNGGHWLVEKFGQHQIGAERLLISGRKPRKEFFDLHRQIDIGLDTFPYTGQTITCNFLWAGVPTVTLAGRTHTSRAGVSILSAMGMQELIANSPEEYIRLAAELGNDLPKLAGLRSTLRQRFEASPIRDEAGLARAIESAFMDMNREA